MLTSVYMFLSCDQRDNRDSNVNMMQVISQIGDSIVQDFRAQEYSEQVFFRSLNQTK